MKRIEIALETPKSGHYAIAFPAPMVDVEIDGALIFRIEQDYAIIGADKGDKVTVSGRPVDGNVNRLIPIDNYGC